MAKHKFGDVVYLVSTGHKATIESVITDYGAKTTKYKLTNGMTVCCGSITDKEPINFSRSPSILEMKGTDWTDENVAKAERLEADKLKPKKQRKKKSLPPVEDVDQTQSEQGVEKVDYSQENTSKD